MKTRTSRVPIVAYHFSTEKLTRESLLPNKGMWLVTQISKARAYLMDARANNLKGFLYEAYITGRILTTFELDIYLTQLGIDPQDFVGEMVSNPTDFNSDPRLKQLVKLVKCDGFFHTDYDPMDNQKDITVLYIINPLKSVKRFVKLI